MLAEAHCATFESRVHREVQIAHISKEDECEGDGSRMKGVEDGTKIQDCRVCTSNTASVVLG